eukprot:Amastigsp_a676618_39.p3 type:complete len:178 gc:universal Amastigsp_a676618_39:1140-1673(+)
MRIRASPCPSSRSKSSAGALCLPRTRPPQSSRSLSRSCATRCSDRPRSSHTSSRSTPKPPEKSGKRASASTRRTHTAARTFSGRSRPCRTPGRRSSLRKLTGSRRPRPRWCLALAPLSRSSQRWARSTLRFRKLSFNSQPSLTRSPSAAPGQTRRRSAQRLQSWRGARGASRTRTRR